jgi:hypothetical protein
MRPPKNVPTTQSVFARLVGTLTLTDLHTATENTDRKDPAYKIIQNELRKREQQVRRHPLRGQPVRI